MSILLTDHEWIDHSETVKAADRYWYYGDDYVTVLKEAMEGKEKSDETTT